MPDQGTDIFGQQTSDGKQQAPSQGGGGAVPTDELATLLANIKNERGEQKYKTVQEALNALGHAQNYIPQLKQSQQELEQKLNDALGKLSKMDTLEQTLQQLTQQQSQTPTQGSGALSKEEIAALLEQQLSQRESQQKQSQNLQTVVNKVKEVHGEKASEAFYKKAEELGMTKEEFNSFAAQRPQAVLQLLGLDKVGTQQRTPSQGFNSAAFQPQESSLVSRNQKPALVGATTFDLQEESANARKMVDELHSQGKTVHDLTDPKVYFKYFK